MRMKMSCITARSCALMPGSPGTCSMEIGGADIQKISPHPFGQRTHGWCLSTAQTRSWFWKCEELLSELNSFFGQEKFSPELSSIFSGCLINNHRAKLLQWVLSKPFLLPLQLRFRVCYLIILVNEQILKYKDIFPL